MEQFSAPKLGKISLRSRTPLFVALVALSLLAHGVVLGLPWPQTESRQEPAEPPPAADPETVVDVAILPTDTLKPLREKLANQPAEASAAAGSATPRVERSPASSNSSASQPQPLASSPPPPPPGQTAQPTDPIPNPADELPPEPGSSGLTSQPPPLQERLRDPSEYQYDRTQHFDELDQDFLAISADWAEKGVLSHLDAPLRLPYELGETCLAAPPLPGTLMVVVDTEGNFPFRGEPTVVSSTGYAILDKQAEQLVRDGEYSLDRPNVPTTYIVDIEVLYPSECLEP